MKKIILSIVTLVILFNLKSAFADSEYPQSPLEKEMEDTGSLLGGEGIVFRPGKVKNNSTQSTSLTVNKYLYLATIDVLSFAPLASVDPMHGVVITEWYVAQDNPSSKFKINVFIKDNIISADAIEVNAYEMIKQKNEWQDNGKKPSLSSALEDKILRKARELYLNETKK